MLSPNSAYLVKSRRRIARVVMAPLPTVKSTAGSWHYRAPKLTSKMYALALLASVGLHAMVMVAFNDEKTPVRAVAPAPEAIVQLEMNIPQEEPEELIEELNEPEPQSAIAVPQLADIPSVVSLNAITQELDLRPATNVDLSGASLVSIPVNIARGTGRGGAGDLFNLADLDRVPEAVAQPSPQFPYAMKSAGITEARVVVSFVVNADGRVSEARVVESSAMGFESSALAAVTRWKFRPGMKAGRKVNTRMLVPIKFQIVDEV